MIRVLLADDHAIVRRGVARLISEQQDMTIVGEVGDGDEVIPAVKSSQCDILILDLSLPNRSGMEIVEEIARQSVQVKIIILSMYSEDQLALNLLHKGASAYLSKQRDPQELIDAIRRVAAGRRYLTETLAEIALESQQESQELPHHRLSGREHQVFLMIIGGNKVAAIAEELHISASTVSSHVAAIKQKLGVASVSEVIRYASRVGLV